MVEWHSHGERRGIPVFFCSFTQPASQGPKHELPFLGDPSRPSEFTDGRSISHYPAGGGEPRGNGTGASNANSYFASGERLACEKNPDRYPNTRLDSFVSTGNYQASGRTAWCTLRVVSYMCGLFGNRIAALLVATQLLTYAGLPWWHRSMCHTAHAPCCVDDGVAHLGERHGHAHGSPCVSTAERHGFCGRGSEGTGRAAPGNGWRSERSQCDVGCAICAYCAAPCVGTSVLLAVSEWLVASVEQTAVPWRRVHVPSSYLARGPPRNAERAV